MNPITWWDWLLCPGPELRRLGADPKERLRYTGHGHPLSSRWAQTIGMWCLNEPKEIIGLVAPNTNKENARAIFDMFKSRNKLRTKKHWMRDNLHDPNAENFMIAGPVIVATLAHSRILKHIRRSNDALSPGAAAEVANRVFLERTVEDGRPVWKATESVHGLLPIEMLLYYYAIEHILEETGTTVGSWTEGLGPWDEWLSRAKLWKRFECDNLVALPAAALDRYPVDDA